jgi:iron complex transport system substrate-binding protein
MPTLSYCPNPNYPRIACLTEEAVEILYLLGKSEHIIAISEYAKRPLGVEKLHPKVCHFLNGDVSQIVALKPDLVIGYSDVQIKLSAQLIDAGLNVMIFNHRSLKEILNYIFLIGRMVGAEDKATQLVAKLKQKMELINLPPHRPKVYFEEWDHPQISSIQWVSELIELCGGINITDHLSQHFKSKDRIVTHEFILDSRPDIMLSCWCGKAMNKDSIVNREGYGDLPFVKNNQLFELDPSIFLQPGPAPFIDGIDVLSKLFQNWSDLHANR